MITDSPGETISRGNLILPLSSTLDMAMSAPVSRIFPRYYIFPHFGEFTPHRNTAGVDRVECESWTGYLLDSSRLCQSTYFSRHDRCIKAETSSECSCVFSRSRKPRQSTEWNWRPRTQSVHNRPLGKISTLVPLLGLRPVTRFVR